MTSTTSRRRLHLILGLAILALAVGGIAQASASKADAPIQKKNELCGADSGGKTIGEATFRRSGDSLNVKAKMTRAPNGTYYLSLWDADTCSEIKSLGKFKVTGGSGSKAATVDITGYSSFFVDAYYNDGGYDNDSTIVTP